MSDVALRLDAELDDRDLERIEEILVDGGVRRDAILDVEELEP